MRTSIFLGLLLLAKAIRADVHENSSNSLAVFVAIMMLIDLIEFLKKLKDE